LKIDMEELNRNEKKYEFLQGLSRKVT
jgi:hypothetical protein